MFVTCVAWCAHVYVFDQFVPKMMVLASTDSGLSVTSNPLFAVSSGQRPFMDNSRIIYNQLTINASSAALKGRDRKLPCAKTSNCCFKAAKKKWWTAYYYFTLDNASSKWQAQYAKIYFWGVARVLPNLTQATLESLWRHVAWLRPSQSQGTGRTVKVLSKLWKLHWQKHLQGQKKDKDNWKNRQVPRWWDFLLFICGIRPLNWAYEATRLFNSFQISPKLFAQNFKNEKTHFT